MAPRPLAVVSPHPAVFSQMRFSLRTGVDLLRFLSDGAYGFFAVHSALFFFLGNDGDLSCTFSRDLFVGGVCTRNPRHINFFVLLMLCIFARRLLPLFSTARRTRSSSQVRAVCAPGVSFFLQNHPFSMEINRNHTGNHGPPLTLFVFPSPPLLRSLFFFYQPPEVSAERVSILF